MTLRLLYRGLFFPLKHNYLMGGGSSPACSSCRQSAADLLHCFSTCPVSQSFWQIIHQFLVNHTTDQISRSPAWTLFGSLQERFPPNSNTNKSNVSPLYCGAQNNFTGVDLCRSSFFTYLLGIIILPITYGLGRSPLTKKSLALRKFS